jgi:hypothetical protein
VSHWLAKGRPPGAKTLGSFEAWARVVGGVLACAGITGFLENVAALYDAADVAGAAWRSFLAEWALVFGQKTVGVAEVLPVAMRIDGIDLGSGEERSRAIRLGRLLQSRRETIAGGYRLLALGRYQGTARWRLEALP